MATLEDVKMNAFSDELNKILEETKSPNALMRSGRTPEHVSTYLDKRAAAIGPAARYGGTALGAVAGYEALRRANKDRKLGKSIRMEQMRQARMGGQ